jgi:hypothetical protein
MSRNPFRAQESTQFGGKSGFPTAGRACNAHYANSSLGLNLFVYFLHLVKVAKKFSGERQRQIEHEAVQS